MYFNYKKTTAQEATTQSKTALGRNPPAEKHSSKPRYEDSCIILSFQLKPRRWRWTSWKKPRRSGPRWVWTDEIGLFYFTRGFVRWLDRGQVSTSSAASTCLWYANVIDRIMPKFGFFFPLFFVVGFFYTSVAFCYVASPCRGCKVTSSPRNTGMWWENMLRHQPQQGASSVTHSKLDRRPERSCQLEARLHLSPTL